MSNLNLPWCNVRLFPLVLSRRVCKRKELVEGIAWMLVLFLCWFMGSRSQFPLILLVAAKSRAIAIPVDLDSQVNNLFLKSHNIVQKTAMNWRMTARNAARRDSVLAASRDYRNIIERLQVTAQLPSLT